MSEKRTETEQPTVKRADALEQGDHVIEVAEYGRKPQPLKVLFAHPYRDGDGKPMVAVMLDAPTKIDGFSPVDMRVPVDAKFEMADEQDLAAFHAVGQRKAFVVALRQLADAIAEHALPVPRFSGFLSGCLESRADLEAWAAHLDVPVEMGGTAGDIPVTDRDLKVGDGPKLNVRWQAPSEPAPAPEPSEPELVDKVDQEWVAESEQEWLFTFGSGQQHDGRFVRIFGSFEDARERMCRVFGTAWCDQYDWRRFDQLGMPAQLTELPKAEWPTGEHRYAEGWKGGPGECGASCACGLTYDGFDTLAEPSELIDRHVALATTGSEPAEA